MRTRSAAPPVSGVTELTAPAGAIDLIAAEAAIAQLLTALGQDAASERLRATPARAATALLGLVASPGAPEVKLMPAEGYRGLVLVRDIPFQSLCEHHLLPFRGRVHVGFLPGDHLVGLSTLARAVEYVAHGLQLQERMTQQLHDWLQLELNPLGAGVVIQAEHLCMSFRGIGTSDTRLTTSLFSGALGDDAASRSAFFGSGSVSTGSLGPGSLGTGESAPPPSRGIHD